MKTNILKSLQRHNKLNHAAVNGVSHLGNMAWSGHKSGVSKKALLQDDKPEPMRVPLADFAKVPQ